MKKRTTIDFGVFRNNLLMLAANRKILMKDIASDIGVTKTTMSRYITGERTPDLAYVVKMSEYFGVSIEWLLGLNDVQTMVVNDESKELLEKFALATPEDRLVIKTLLSKYGEN